MTIGRTELALALDDMAENQDGVRFQRMALQLARQTWPEIICSEPGKDLGVDARVPTSLSADGTGRAFACSITPTYAKIHADALKIRTNYPDLKVMIFATPAEVSNQRGEGWIQKLKKELGIELSILSREDLLSRLLESTSAPARQLLIGFAASKTQEFAQWSAEVTSQVAAGELSYRFWSPFLTTVPADMQQTLLTSILTTDLGHHGGDTISVVASVIDVPAMEQAFATYCDVKEQTQQHNAPYTDVRYAILRQLAQLFRETPSKVTVAAMAPHFASPLNEATLGDILSLLGRGVPSANQREQPLDLRPELPEQLCQDLRRYLKQAVPFACALEDPKGTLVANLSSTLSRVGNPEDLSDLDRLMRTDIARWDAIRAAQASGQHMQLTGHQQVHVRSILTLGAPNADHILIALLNIDSYVLYAAKALLELAQIEPDIFDSILAVRRGTVTDCPH